MSTPYLGEIRTVGFSFPPQGWATCNGQPLSIAENEALYTLLGTTYGGDGVQTFNLPNLQSRIVAGTGTGTGLSSYVPGQVLGSETVTLTTAQMPLHQHTASATPNATTAGTPTNDPTNAYPGPGTAASYASAPTAGAQLEAGAFKGTVQPVGGSLPHNNLQPVLALNFIICTEGIYPPRP